jgi:hypothetical protein
LEKEKKPDMVFLMKTKLRASRMERVQVKLEFDYMFVVDSVGRSGGLALFWMMYLGVEIHNFN